MEQTRSEKLQAWEQRLRNDGLTLVESSNVKAVKFSKNDQDDLLAGETGKLEVAFHNGQRWIYADVPQHIYEAMLAAPAPDSLGKYFNRVIRNNYMAKRCADAQELL